MAIQDSDLFLIDDAGVSKKIRASKLKDGLSNEYGLMKLLVNKPDYSSRWVYCKDVQTNLPDNHWVLVERSGTSYKVNGTDFQDYFPSGPAGATGTIIDVHSPGTPTETVETSAIINVLDTKNIPDISINEGGPAEDTQLENMFNGKYSVYPRDFVTAPDGRIIQLDNINEPNVTKVEYYTWSGGNTKSKLNGTWSDNDGSGEGWKVAYEGPSITLNSLYFRMRDNVSFIKVGAVRINGNYLLGDGGFKLTFPNNQNFDFFRIDDVVQKKGITATGTTKPYSNYGSDDPNVLFNSTSNVQSGSSISPAETYLSHGSNTENSDIIEFSEPITSSENLYLYAYRQGNGGQIVANVGLPDAAQIPISNNSSWTYWNTGLKSIKNIQFLDASSTSNVITAAAFFSINNTVSGRIGTPGGSYAYKITDIDSTNNQISVNGGTWATASEYVDVESATITGFPGNENKTWDNTFGRTDSRNFAASPNSANSRDEYGIIFSSPITGNVIEIQSNNPGSTAGIYFNGSSTKFDTTGQPTTNNLGPGSAFKNIGVTSLSSINMVNAAGSGNTPIIMAIKVDGTILVGGQDRLKSTEPRLSVEYLADPNFADNEAIRMVDIDGLDATYTPVTSQITSVDYPIWNFSDTALITRTTQNPMPADVANALFTADGTGAKMPQNQTDDEGFFCYFPDYTKRLDWLPGEIIKCGVYAEGNGTFTLCEIYTPPGRKPMVEGDLTSGISVTGTSTDYSANFGTSGLGRHGFYVRRASTNDIKINSFFIEDDLGNKLILRDGNQVNKNTTGRVLTFANPCQDLKFFQPDDVVQQVLSTGWNFVRNASSTQGTYNSMVEYDGILYAPVNAQSGTNGVVFSTDSGATWAQNNSGTAFTARDIAVNPATGAFVIAASSTNQFLVSNDGCKTFSQYSLPAQGAARSIKQLMFGNGVFVASTNPVAEAELCYSTDDGVTWNNSPATKGLGAWNDIIFDGSRFLAVNSSAPYIYESTDGINWSSAASGLPSAQWNQIAYAPDKNLYVLNNGNNPDRMWVSADLTTWSAYNNSAWDSYSMTEVQYIAGYFVALNDENGEIFTSPDGQSWTFILKLSDGIKRLFESQDGSILGLGREWIFNQTNFVACISRDVVARMMTVDGGNWIGSDGSGSGINYSRTWSDGFAANSATQGVGPFNNVTKDFANRTNASDGNGLLLTFSPPIPFTSFRYCITSNIGQRVQLNGTPLDVFTENTGRGKYYTGSETQISTIFLDSDSSNNSTALVWMEVDGRQLLDGSADISATQATGLPKSGTAKADGVPDDTTFRIKDSNGEWIDGTNRLGESFYALNASTRVSFSRYLQSLNLRNASFDSSQVNVSEPFSLENHANLYFTEAAAQAASATNQSAERTVYGFTFYECC